METAMADGTGDTRPGGMCAEAAAIGALVDGYSIEVSSRSPKDVDACANHLQPGTDVYISFIAGDTPGASVATAAALRRGGFNPVPHVGARHMASLAQADEFLARLAGEAGVEQILAIAGDLPRPAGPLVSTAHLLRTGIVAARGIRRVGLAGYPEGHPVISATDLDAALSEKLALLGGQGLAAYVVTQFCFDPRPIAAWLVRLAATGIAIPVRIGVTGPASAATLLRSAVRCGIGNSMRMLSARGVAVARLLHEAAPDAILRDLAGRTAAAGPLGVHFFPFGGVARAARWANACRGGAVVLDPSGGGGARRNSYSQPRRLK
jgi:methylenetetrahydrofolate reductase (NADPH)